MAEYKITIKKTGNDKISVAIEYRNDRRIFDIAADKDGLAITADNELIIMPRAANRVMIDQQ